MRAVFSFFPLLVIPVAIYNIIAVTYSGTTVNYDAVNNAAPLLELLSGSLLTFPMISGVTWSITNGEMLVIVAIALLFIEILKSTSTGTSSIFNHAISLSLFVVCLIEFPIMPNFATSTFFIIMSMTLLDVLAGVIVTIVSARRDFGVGEGFA